MVFKNLKKGFSMIEMLISIVIIGLVSGLSVIIFSEASESYFSGTSSKKLMDEVRLSFWRITQEIRGIESNNNLLSSTASKLHTDSDQNGLSIEFVSDGNIVFNKDGGANILTDKVDPSVTNAFSYLNDSYSSINLSGSLTADQANSTSLIKVQMQLKDFQKMMPVSSHIYPRNFRYGNKMSYHEY